jgi:hypothetical protein
MKIKKEPCHAFHERRCLACPKSECRHWIDYPEDNNCSIVCANKNDDGLTLEETAKRLGVSHVRVYQIEQQIKKKLARLFTNEAYDDF